MCMTLGNRFTPQIATQKLCMNAGEMCTLFQYQVLVMHCANIYANDEQVLRPLIDQWECVLLEACTTFDALTKLHAAECH